MEFLQHFQVYSWFIVIAFRKSSGHDLHQIMVSQIIFRQKHQMIITVLPASDSFFIESRSRCNIDFASEDRLNPCCSCRTVKIDHTIHDTMIRDRHAVHPEFFYPGYTLFDFI